MIRPAILDDVPACAAIKNDWIDETPWLPRIHPADDMERHYREAVFLRQDVSVVGDPVEGFIAIDRTENFVTSLFCRTRRRGYGKQLLDFAKSELAEEINLWTFVANKDGRRFYEREGFLEVQRTDGDNEEGLPDVLLRWRAKM